MIRTQISLPEELKRRLDSDSAKTGLSMSELIRRVLSRHYAVDERALEEDLAAMDAAFGAWKDRDFTGEEYVEAIRPGRRPVAW